MRFWNPRRAKMYWEMLAKSRYYAFLPAMGWYFREERMKGPFWDKEDKYFFLKTRCSAADLCWINAGIQWSVALPRHTSLSLGRVAIALGEVAIQAEPFLLICNQGSPKTRYFVTQEWRTKGHKEEVRGCSLKDWLWLFIFLWYYWGEWKYGKEMTRGGDENS